MTSTLPDDRHPQLEGWGEWVRTRVRQDGATSYVAGVDMVDIYADHEQVRIDHDPDGTPRWAWWGRRLRFSNCGCHHCDLRCLAAKRGWVYIERKEMPPPRELRGVENDE